MMASEIRALDDDELTTFADLAKGAYPGMTLTASELAERMRRGQADDPSIGSYGLFRAGMLLGGMRHFDFTMSYHGLPVAVGGVGMVAVDLLHKKRGVAKELIQFYLRHYRAAGAPLAALYPFRPDFYRAMGFGYGTKLSHYQLRPTDFPPGERSGLRHLGPADAQALLACYRRHATVTHGMFQRELIWATRTFESLERRVLAFWVGDDVQGYMIYQFQRGSSFIQNDIQVVELVWETPAAMRALCAFLHSQADQIARIILNIQDDQLHHLVHDPRNGSGNLHPSVYHETNVQGIGLMYRVIDLPGFFRTVAGHRFGRANLTLAIEMADSFLPENAGRVVVQFRDGTPQVAPDAAAQVSITLPVEQLSALLMGSADFHSLFRYGLAEIDDPAYSEEVHRLFLSPTRPVCLTAF